MSSPFLVLVSLTLGLRGLIAAIIFQKGLHRLYPFFLVYLGFSVLSSVLRLAVSSYHDPFFDVFWATEAVYIVLSLLVLFEVFRKIFRGLHTNKWFRLLLCSLVIVILALALGTPMRRLWAFSSLDHFVLSVTLAVRLLQVSALVFFLGLVLFFNLRGRRYELGIVLGYGLFASVYLVGLALRNQLGKNYDELLSYGHSIAYSCAVVIWLWTFLRKESLPTLGDPALAVSPENAADFLRRLRTVYLSFTRRRWVH